MKINKEKEVNTEIHKKRTGKIHKKNEIGRASCRERV